MSTADNENTHLCKLLLTYFRKSNKKWRLDAYYKAGFTNRKHNKRSTDNFAVLLFTRLTLQGIVCYTFVFKYP